LIPHYLQALADLGRWEEIERILSRPAGMPVSAAFAALWRARAAKNTDPEQLNTRQHLNVVYEACGHGRDGSTAKLAADIAEEAGLYDLAAKFYQGLSEYQPKAKISMLEKVYEMATRSRDTDEVIHVAKQLLALRPQNPQYIERLQYLQLVSGEDMEIQAAHILSFMSSKSRQDQLHRALAAYRLGDLKLMKEHLHDLADVSDFTPGQKAVHAGLLSISGQVGRAFQIAENISTLLLLKEELRFLERAL
jgi:tetratricopeptide (TPR) repeat protein